jgi:recombination protein RecA
MGIRDRIEVMKRETAAQQTDPAEPSAAKAKGKTKAKAPPDDYMDTIITAIRRGISKGSNGCVSILSEDNILADVDEWIPTGFHQLDHILGGGWAVGRMSEVFGAEGAGKSALAHRTLRAAQDMGIKPVYIDYEVALDRKHLKSQGIDPERVVYATPETLEDGMDMVNTMLNVLVKEKPDVPALIVLDSIATAPTAAESAETEAGKKHVAETARLLSKFARRFLRRVALTRCHLMFLNQEREDIGNNAYYAEPITYGGKALRYAASQRVRISRLKTLTRKIKGQTVATGYLVKAQTKKNRCAPPHRTAYWVLDFKVGPSVELTLLEMLLYFKMARRTKQGIRVKGLKDTTLTCNWPRYAREHWTTLDTLAGSILAGTATPDPEDEPDDDPDDDPEDTSEDDPEE